MDLIFVVSKIKALLEGEEDDNFAMNISVNRDISKRGRAEFLRPFDQDSYQTDLVSLGSIGSQIISSLGQIEGISRIVITAYELEIYFNKSFIAGDILFVRNVERKIISKIRDIIDPQFQISNFNGTREDEPFNMHIYGVFRYPEKYKGQYST